MTLKSRVNDDLKAAMRTGDARRRDALRLLLAAVKQREVDERKELGDADIVGVIERMIKQRRESITQFEKGGREDLAENERFEAESNRDRATRSGKGAPSSPEGGAVMCSASITSR